MSTTAPLKPKEPPVLNLPNYLTASRLVLGVVLFVLIHHEQWIWSNACFALAAVTDYLDGYFARKQGLSSTLGRNFDPLVDKVVVCGAYIFLVPVPDSGLTPWMAVVVMSREMIITSLRSFLENLGATFGADWLGKIKMVLQCAALFAIFTTLRFPNDTCVLIRDLIIWSMLAATAISGLQYLWRAFVLFRKDDMLG